MSEHKVYRVIGLMSGTSLDGVDIAYLETDGHAYVKPLLFETVLYTRGEKDLIRAAFGKNKRDQSIDLAEKTVTDKHIFAVRNFMNYHELGGKVDLIGFHGQTIFHDPKQAFTWQIGNGGALAKATGVDVVCDFRSNDMKHGGQGAPLIPYYHKALAEKLPKPMAIINIGGVSNITWIGEKKILAFDCGPGNALMDDCMVKRKGESYDKNGDLARTGTADMEMVREWLRYPFFAQEPPKSLDRDEWDIRSISYLSDADAMATLCEFSAQAMHRALKHCPKTPKICYITGGGRHNTFMMERLATLFGCQIKDISEIGADGDALEAQGFGYLAVRSLLGLPLSEQSTTGAKEPVTGGVLHRNT